MATIPVDSRIDSRVTAKTADFFSRQHRMLIGGSFVTAASGKTFPVYNPATGEVVAHVPEAEAEDVDRAVRAARGAFDHGPWSRMTPSQRGQLLWKLADLLEANLGRVCGDRIARQRQTVFRSPRGGSSLGDRYVPLHGGVGHEDLR